jgi:hypothetical protein
MTCFCGIPAAHSKTQHSTATYRISIVAVAASEECIWSTLDQQHLAIYLHITPQREQAAQHNVR